MYFDRSSTWLLAGSPPYSTRTGPTRNARRSTSCLIVDRGEKLPASRLGSNLPPSLMIGTFRAHRSSVERSSYTAGRSASLMYARRKAIEKAGNMPRHVGVFVLHLSSAKLSPTFQNVRRGSRSHCFSPIENQ